MICLLFNGDKTKTGFDYLYQDGSQPKQKSKKESRNSAHISFNGCLTHRVISYINIIFSLVIPENENQTIHKYIMILFQIYVVVVLCIIICIKQTYFLFYLCIYLFKCYVQYCIIFEFRINRKQFSYSAESNTFRINKELIALF